jgi:hypothetical protein
MGRPTGSPNKDKPLRDALRMEAKALENGEIIQHPRGSLRAQAQAMHFKSSDGDVTAFKEIADRLDGKVPQAVVGDDDHPPVGEVSPRQAARAVMDLFREIKLDTPP